MPGDRFHVRLLPEEGFVGGGGERVIAEIGLEGFNILDAGGGRTLRKYPLHHISRWSLRGTSLILFTRSPVSTAQRSCDCCVCWPTRTRTHRRATCRRSLMWRTGQ